jgi:hypothetical protein
LQKKWDGQNPVGLGGWNPKIFIGLSFTYAIVFLSTMDYLTSKFSKVPSHKVT